MRSTLHASRPRVRTLGVAVAAVLTLILSILVSTPAQALNDTGTGGVFVPATGRILDTKNNVGGYNTPMPAKTWRTVTVAGKAGIPADGSVGAVSVVATLADISGQGQLFGRPDGAEPATMLGIYGGVDRQNTSFSAVLAVSADGTIDVQTETVSRLILDVQGYYTSGDDGTAPGGFVPMNGKRIVDTRSGLGATKASVASGQSIDVQVTGLASGIPSGASAVIVNLISANTSAATGYLTPYPTGVTRPANSLHYAAEMNTSVQAQVKLSSTGKITIYNSSTTTNILVDVQGYFTAAGQGGAVFTPGTGRAYDTRTSGNTALAQTETRSIQIAGKAGVPVMGSGISAVVLTLTSLKTTPGTGAAVVWADGTTKPNTTSINFDQTTIRTNTITVPLGANGKVSLYNGAAATNYVIDIQGWYVDPLSPTVSCPSPYAAESITATIPTAPIVCTVSAPPASGSDQALTVYSDGIESYSALSATASITQTVSLPATGGLHDIVALTADSAGNPLGEIEYSFAVGGAWDRQSLIPAPSDGSTTARTIALSVQPENDSFPGDVLVQYSVFDGTSVQGAPALQSDWLQDGFELGTAQLAADHHYVWYADIKGTPTDSTAEVTRRTDTFSFTTDQSVTFTVQGDVSAQGDEALTLEDLDATEVGLADLEGVQVTEKDGLLAFDPSLPAPDVVQSEPTMEITADYTVKASWIEKQGKRVYFRADAWNKVRDKHALKWTIVKAVTQKPNEILRGMSKTKFSYFRGAKQIECWQWNCKIKRATTVQVVVDYRELRDGKTYGVVTAYCYGTTKCPKYVNDAIH